MSATNSDEEELLDLPPSAKLVFKVLEHDGPLTQKEVVEESMLSPRTVRYAVDRLKEIDAIDEQVYMVDTRQSLYRVNEAMLEDGDAACCAD